MIHPAWFVASGALALSVVCYVGMNRAENRAAQEKAQWAEEKSLIEREHSEAMAKQIEAQNKTMKELETINAESQKQRALAAGYAASAVVAGSNAARAERRLRDASATAAIAASAAASQAGVAGKCDAVAATANLLAGVLERIDSAASEIGEAAVGISGFADKALGQRNECIARYRAVN